MSALVNTPSNSEKTRKHKSKHRDKEHAKSSHRPNASTLIAIRNEDISSDEDELPALNDTLVPPGSVRLTDVLDTDDFDYDTLKDNDDLEVWVMRVPDGIKPKHLTNFTFDLPPLHASSSQKLGSLNKKSGSYNVWSVRPSASSGPGEVDLNEDGGTGNAVGGEELLGMNVLVPREKKDGRLFLAPKPIKHHIVLTSQPVQPALPTPPPSSPSDVQNVDSNMFKSPARYQHPKHLLKHRFVPTGASSRIPPSTSSTPESPATLPIPTEVRELGDPHDVKAEKKKDKKKKAKEERKNAEIPSSTLSEETPKKKRKAEGEGKKAKRTKTVS